MILHGHGWRLRTLKRSENIIRWLRKISQHEKALWVLGFNSWSTGNNHQYHFRKHVLIKLGASILWCNNLQHANVVMHVLSKPCSPPFGCSCLGGTLIQHGGSASCLGEIVPQNPQNYMDQTNAGCPKYQSWDFGIFWLYVCLYIYPIFRQTVSNSDKVM